MSIVSHTPTELIAALRATADDAEKNMGDNLTAVRLRNCITGMRQAATMLKTFTRPETASSRAAQPVDLRSQRLSSCVVAMRQAADMLETMSARTAATATTVITKPKASGDLTSTHPPPRIEVTDQLAQRLADRFWIIIQEQRHGTDIGAALLAQQTQGVGGGSDYFKRALEEALAAGPVQPVDLRPAHPDIADRVARAYAAWPGDYSSIAIALMDGATNMQPNAADAIASLILLLQSVTISPTVLPTELQARAKEAEAWRIQQGDHPQWSAG
jgi:hypothetical protein